MEPRVDSRSGRRRRRFPTTSLRALAAATALVIVVGACASRGRLDAGDAGPSVSPAQLLAADSPAPVTPDASSGATLEPVARLARCNPDYPAATLGCTRDGSRLLVQRHDLNLFVVHADGSQTQLTDRQSDLKQFNGSARPAGATISPDGSLVVYAGVTKLGMSCHNGAIFAVDAGSGPARVLWTSHVPQNGIVRYPTFSPDGTRIAFADGYCDWNHSVWVMNADGTNARQVLVPEAVGLEAGHVWGLAWSPAGDRLALIYQGAAYSFTSDGTDLRSTKAFEAFCWPGLRC